MRKTLFQTGCMACLVCLLMISGCASFSLNKPVAQTNKDASIKSHGNPLDKIAADFVNALVQIPGYEPQFATIALERDNAADSFIEAVRKKLEQSGFGIRWVNSESDNNLFQYRRKEEASVNQQTRYRYELAFGDVEFRRTYIGVEETMIVHPVTPLYIRGADASKVVLNDGAFAGQQPDSVEPERKLSVPEEVNPLSVWARKEPNSKPLSMPLVALPTVRNVFELGGSNHTDALIEHSTVVERILTFPNDSLRLGSNNKQIIHAVVSSYNATTDLFSILGCSLGPTAIKGGNAALALGRASRVKEALLFAGVEPDKILDEGCWAGDSDGNTLPKRGVILTLNRRI